MKILVKIEPIVNPDLSVHIGLKNSYHEFDVVEDAFDWIFKNKNSIQSYKIFTIEPYKSKNDKSKNDGHYLVSNSSGISPVGYSGSASINMNSGESVATFH